jgi:hypothetical protein
MEAIQNLSTPDLLALATALRSGRLVPPYSEVALRRHTGSPAVPDVVAIMSKLAGEGMQASHLALLIEAIAKTRKNQRSVTELVELVWSGPQATGITDRDTGVVVRELFSTAMREVLVAGFAVYQGHSVFRCLAERILEVPDPISIERMARKEIARTLLRSPIARRESGKTIKSACEVCRRGQERGTGHIGKLHRGGTDTKYRSRCTHPFARVC